MGTHLECLFIHSWVFKYFFPAEVLAAMVHLYFLHCTKYLRYWIKLCYHHSWITQECCCSPGNVASVQWKVLLMFCSELRLAKAQVKGWLMVEWDTQPKPLIIFSHLIFHHCYSSWLPSSKGFVMEAQVPGSTVTKVQLPDNFLGGSGRNSLAGTTVRTVAEEKN